MGFCCQYLFTHFVVMMYACVNELYTLNLLCYFYQTSCFTSLGDDANLII